MGQNELVKTPGLTRLLGEGFSCSCVNLHLIFCLCFLLVASSIFFAIDTLARVAYPDWLDPIFFCPPFSAPRNSVVIESSWIIGDKLGSLSTEYKYRLRILCGQTLRPMLRGSFPLATGYSKYTLTRKLHGSAQQKK